MVVDLKWYGLRPCIACPCITLTQASDIKNVMHHWLYKNCMHMQCCCSKGCHTPTVSIFLTNSVISTSAPAIIDATTHSNAACRAAKHWCYMGPLTYRNKGGLSRGPSTSYSGLLCAHEVEAKNHFSRRVCRQNFSCHLTHVLFDSFQVSAGRCQ